MQLQLHSQDIPETAEQQFDPPNGWQQTYVSQMAVWTTHWTRDFRRRSLKSKRHYFCFMRVCIYPYLPVNLLRSDETAVILVWVKPTNSFKTYNVIVDPRSFKSKSLFIFFVSKTSPDKEHGRLATYKIFITLSFISIDHKTHRLIVIRFWSLINVPLQSFFFHFSLELPHLWKLPCLKC